MAYNGNPPFQQFVARTEQPLAGPPGLAIPSFAPVVVVSTQPHHFGQHTSLSLVDPYGVNTHSTPPIASPFSLGLPVSEPAEKSPPRRSTFDELLDRLASNLQVFEPMTFAPLESSNSLATLMGDRSAPSPASFETHGSGTAAYSDHSESGPQGSFSEETRYQTTDDDEVSVITGQGSPSAASSSWAKIAISGNLGSAGPKALARFKAIEDEVINPVEDLLNDLTQDAESKSAESRPIVKVSGLPRGFTQADLKKMLKALGVRSSIIHFIVNRRTFEKTTSEGVRTPFPVDEVYLEFKHREYAEMLLHAHKPSVAGKPVLLDRSDTQELRFALFPRLRSFNGRDSYPLIAKDEIAALLDFCSRAEASFPADNSLPFEHVCSILQKFARMDSDKVTDIQRNAIYDLGKLAIGTLHHKLSAKRGHHIGLQQSLLVKMVVAALTVPTFTVRQKFNITKESGLSVSMVPSDLQSYFTEPPKIARYASKPE